MKKKKLAWKILNAVKTAYQSNQLDLIKENNKRYGIYTTPKIRTVSEVLSFFDVVKAKFNNNLNKIQCFHRRIYSKKLADCQDDLNKKEPNDYIYDQLDQLNTALDDILKNK